MLPPAGIPAGLRSLRIGRDNLEMVNEIIVSFLKFLLEEKCQDPESDPGIMNHRLLEMIKYVTGA